MLSDINHKQVIRHDATHFSYMQSEGKPILSTGDASRCIVLHAGTSFIRPVHVIQYPWFFCLKPTAGVLSYVLISWSNQDPGRFTEGHSCWSDSLSKLWIHTCRLFSPNLEETHQQPSPHIVNMTEMQTTSRSYLNNLRVISLLYPLYSLVLFDLFQYVQFVQQVIARLPSVCAAGQNSHVQKGECSAWLCKRIIGHVGVMCRPNHFRHFKQEPSFIDGWSQHPVKNT